jgi:acetolactate synthase I/II/III large subunit
VDELVKLCDRLGIGVAESFPNYSNFPVLHPMHQGMTPPLSFADFVLVIDSDVPWIETVAKPREGVPVFHIDLDPLKERTPLWQLTARHIARADSLLALKQLNAAVESGKSDGHWALRHEAWRDSLVAKETGEALSAEYLTSRIRENLEPDAIVLNEGITNYKAIAEHIERPMFTSGGGSLGWNGGAAIGFKLANPDKTVVALTGDGSYMFSVPSSVHWMARRYQTPFLQVVYNNGGWRAPRLSTLAVHPEGYASRTEDINVDFGQPPDYGGIAAAAGGSFARVVTDAGDLDSALDEALYAVREEKRAAVLDVIIV